MKKIFKFFYKKGLYIAFFQAWLATFGSLYFSEVQGLTPCLLCWYQRILMYPLAIIYAVAIARKEKSAAYYALPMSAIGTFIALYHYLIQWTSLKNISPISCSAAAECSEKQVVYLGFITIPFLSLMAFLLLTFINIILIKYISNDKRK